jgi:hypothetical protein
MRQAMMRPRPLRLVFMLLLRSGLALAEEPRVDASAAHAAFLEGVKYVEGSSWAEALDAFERAQKLKPHAVTVFNMALCRRALGQSIRAMDLLEASLGSGELPSATREQALALREELSHVVARTILTTGSEQVLVSVDGRPLEDRAGTLYAGTLLPGAGTNIGTTTRTVIIDPGEHTWIFTRKGYEERIERVNLKPGSTSDLSVTLKELPSVVVVESNRTESRVLLDNVYAGFTPLRLTHASGKIAIAIEKSGFDRFEATSFLKPGEETRVTGTLRESSTPITRKWWFYALLGTAAAGIGVTTYFLLRPKEDGGSLNWIVR